MTIPEAYKKICDKIGATQSGDAFSGTLSELIVKIIDTLEKVPAGYSLIYKPQADESLCPVSNGRSYYKTTATYAGATNSVCCAFAASNVTSEADSNGYYPKEYYGGFDFTFHSGCTYMLSFMGYDINNNEETRDTSVCDFTSSPSDVTENTYLYVAVKLLTGVKSEPTTLNELVERIPESGGGGTSGGGIPGGNTVTFMNGTDTYTVVSVPQGMAIAEITAPTTSGFTGWQDAEGNAIAFPHTPSGDETIDAVVSQNYGLVTMSAGDLIFSAVGTVNITKTNDGFALCGYYQNTVPRKVIVCVAETKQAASIKYANSEAAYLGTVEYVGRAWYVYSDYVNGNSEQTEASSALERWCYATGLDGLATEHALETALAILNRYYGV